MAGKSKKQLDARRYLFALKGRTLYTLGQGKPNRIISIDRKAVTVGTEKSPKGTPLQIEKVQDALDRLAKDGKVAVNGKSLGPRSGFIGAVLATVPGAEVDEKPPAVRLPGAKGKARSRRRSPRSPGRRSRRSSARPQPGSSPSTTGSRTTWTGRAELCSSTISSIV